MSQAEVKVRKRGKAQDEVQPVAAPVSRFDREKGEIGDTLKALRKGHGENIIMRGGDKEPTLHYPTGIFTLDLALMGGFPEGRATLLYGHQSAGKSTVSSRGLASAQKKYPEKGAVLIDLEGTYDKQWGALHGVNNEDLIYVEPTSGEQALDIVEGLLRSEEVSMVVVDSLAGLVPMKEIDRSYEDQGMGEAAKMIARFCRKVQQIFNEESKRNHRPSVILINQWRQKMVMMGNPNTLPGGIAQHYVSTFKIDLRNKEVMGKDARGQEVVDHNIHEFKIDKNKISNGIRTGSFTVIRNPSNPLGAGFIDDAGAVVAVAKMTGRITGGGGAYRFQGLDDKFRKLEDMEAYLYSDLDFYEDFKTKLITDQCIALGRNPDWYRRNEVNAFA